MVYCHAPLELDDISDFEALSEQSNGSTSENEEVEWINCTTSENQGKKTKNKDRKNSYIDEENDIFLDANDFFFFNS